MVGEREKFAAAGEERQGRLPLSSHIRPPVDGRARSMVVLLHGYGSDGGDIMTLEPYLRPAAAQAVILAPDAPDACDALPHGRQWFTLTESFSMAGILRGAVAASPVLDAYLNQALALYGLEARRLTLIGFSQGAMLALYTALRRKAAVRGIVGISGLLPIGEGWEKEITARPPVLLIHGEEDGVIPFAALAAAQEALRAHGVAVRTVARPGLGHSIDGGSLEAILRFLRDPVPPVTAQSLPPRATRAPVAVKSH